MIKSLSDLKEFTVLVKSANERRIICAKFDKDKLNCTEEEFNEISHTRSFANTIQQLRALIRKQDTESRTQVPLSIHSSLFSVIVPVKPRNRAQELLRCLENHSLSEREKIEQLLLIRYRLLSQPKTNPISGLLPPRNNAHLIEIID